MVFSYFLLYEAANSAQRRRKNIQKSLNLSHIWLSTELVLRWLRWLFWYCWMRVKFWLVDELKIFFEDQIFWGSWRYKGARNKFKISIVSEMVHQFQSDANRIDRQLKNVFLKLVSMKLMDHVRKIFFNAKILVE